VRRRDALDWAADLIAERGETIAKAFIHAAEKGDWRASEALMNRIYGKPEETVNRVDANPAAQVLTPAKRVRRAESQGSRSLS
jgi:hypothetical protein